MQEFGRKMHDGLVTIHREICAEYDLRDKGPFKRLITLKDDELGHPVLKNIPIPFFWPYFGLVRGGEFIYRIGTKLVQIAEQIANCDKSV